MSSVNKVIIVGNLGKDPDIKVQAGGERIANFTVATSEYWKDRQTGEKKERTEWHRVVIFADALAGVAASYLKKGSKVYVEGMLCTRKWTASDGQDKYTTEIVLKPHNGNLVLLDKNSGGSGPKSADSYEDYGTTKTRGADATGRSSETENSAQTFDLDDEIPF